MVPVNFEIIIERRFGNRFYYISVLPVWLVTASVASDAVCCFSLSLALMLSRQPYPRDSTNDRTSTPENYLHC